MLIRDLKGALQTFTSGHVALISRSSIASAPFFNLNKIDRLSNFAAVNRETASRNAMGDIFFRLVTLA